MRGSRALETYGGAGLLAVATFLLASCSVGAGPKPTSEFEPEEVLTFDGAPAFTAGTYAPLEGSPDILRHGVLRPDAAGCLTLVGPDATAHPVLFPRGTKVLEDGVLKVPGALVHRPAGSGHSEGESVEYRVGEALTGSGPEVSGERAREGAEGSALPEGCYVTTDVTFYLLVP